MYSIVLAMAVSGAAADAPAFGGRGCHGSSGCSGSCYGGYSSGSCSGYSSGCSGSSCHGCHGGRHRHSRHGCHGCHGDNSCCGCHGGYSSCYGGSGYGSCYGSGYGGSCYGSGYGASCYGGGYGAPVGGVTYGACYGGAVLPAGSVITAPATTTPAETLKKSAIDAASATIVVSLPAEATLTIDGAATTSTSALRRFVSPTLEAGQEYVYTLKAEVVRDGKVVAATKKVSVRAGEQSTVSLDLPTASVAAR